MDVQNVKNLDRQTDRQTELVNCNFVKTILMVLVVFYHSILFWNGTWFAEDPIETSAVLSKIAAWLNSFHIYGFVLVSGYIFGYLKLEKGTYCEFGAFVKNKAQRLMLPYGFIALVWVIPVQHLFFQSNLTTIIHKYVLATSPSQLWFLVMLFDVFLIFWLLSDFFAKHDFLGLVLAAGFYGLGVVGGMLLPNIFMIWTACQYIPLFWLGFKLRQRGTALIRQIPVCIWIAVDLILFSLVQYLGNMELVLLKIINLGTNFILHVVGALMAFIVLQKIADKIHWNNAPFSFFEQAKHGGLPRSSTSDLLLYTLAKWQGWDLLQCGGEFFWSDGRLISYGNSLDEV